MKKLYKPGEDNRPAGTYIEVGPRGGFVSDGHHATIDRGDRLPPTKNKGDNWQKV